MPYDIFCQSVIGASHIRKNIPCEDYGLKYETETCKIFVLGDGHGDSNCPRSSIGSKYICEIVKSEFEKFASDIKEQGWVDKLFQKSEADALVSQLILSIMGKWSCMVQDEYANNPLTEQEKQDAAEYAERYMRGERIEHIYGTTLIAGLLTDQYLLLLQQGDGRCVVFDQTGIATQPIPWDDRCFANVTTSVCDVDAAQSCRYYIVNLSDTKVIACFAGSDGVEDSFNSMDKMHAFYRELIKKIQELGTKEFEVYLNEYLPSFSENGSGDDVTICGFCDISATEKILSLLEKENQLVIVQDTINRTQERIDSMTPKLNHLETKFKALCQEIEVLSTNYLTVKQEYQFIAQDLEYQQAETDNCLDESASENDQSEKKEISRPKLSKAALRCLKNHFEKLSDVKKTLEDKIRTTSEQKVKLEQEYLAYKEKYMSFIQMRNDAQKQLDELKNGNSVLNESNVDVGEESMNTIEASVESQSTDEHTAGAAADAIESQIVVKETTDANVNSPVEQTEQTEEVCENIVPAQSTNDKEISEKKKGIISSLFSKIKIGKDS